MSISTNWNISGNRSIRQMEFENFPNFANFVSWEAERRREKSVIYQFIPKMFSEAWAGPDPNWGRGTQFGSHLQCQRPKSMSITWGLVAGALAGSWNQKQSWIQVQAFQHGMQAFQAAPDHCAKCLPQTSYFHFLGFFLWIPHASYYEELIYVYLFSKVLLITAQFLVMASILLSFSV